MKILHNTCEILIKMYVWTTFGFCDGCKNFRKFFSVSREVLVWHWFHWVARTCTATAYRWLFRDSRPSLRTLCSAVVKSPYFFCSQNRSLLVSAEVSMNTVLQFWCLHSWSITFRNWVLSSRGMCEHLRLLVLYINCEGLKPNKNAFRWIFLVHLVCFHGSPWPACHDLSASDLRMHACHFELPLDLLMFPIFWNDWTDPLISMLKTKCCWNMMTILIQREDLITWISALSVKLIKQ